MCRFFCLPLNFFNLFEKVFFVSNRATNVTLKLSFKQRSAIIVNTSIFDSPIYEND